MNAKNLKKYKEWCEKHGTKGTIEGLVEYVEKHCKSPYTLHIFDSHAVLHDIDLDITTVLTRTHQAYYEQSVANLKGLVELARGEVVDEREATHE